MLFLLMMAMATFTVVSPAKALPSSINVVGIPNYFGYGGGELPNSVSGSVDPAFAAFTFSTMGWASVSAASLAPYDTVVLTPKGASIPLTASQQADLMAWVAAGGKLIIYDSECPSVDYSWLPYPFTTMNPGAMGYNVPPIDFVEDNSLGSTNPMSPYYIDIALATTGGWSDYVGDCNTFVTYDPNWCGDIKAYNWFSDPASPGYDGSPPSWTHAYARYGNGLMIYNGFDIDPLRYYSIPDPTDLYDGNGAKIWLMELQQPWNPDGLPCGVVITGITLTPPSATNPLGATHIVTATVLDAFGAPVVGVTVDFEVISGPNMGSIGVSLTDTNGEATWSYIGNTAGTDEIQASFFDTGRQMTIYSNVVEKIWGVAPGVPEFGVSMTLMSSLGVAVFLLLRRRFSKK